jgi:hypothetical protein
MGWFDRLLGRETFEELSSPHFGIEVPAEIYEGDRLASMARGRISRRDALEVPAVLRARNLIAGTLARLPIHIRDKSRQMAAPTTLLEQIDPDVPNVVTFAATYEDLLFESVSWWRITKFGWHGYPSEARHVDVNHVHVSGETVYIEGIPVPDSQVIRFDSPNPPLLVHAARAIRTCRTLDSTAAMYADEPLPLGYFAPRDGTRSNEDPKKIQATLDQWEEARRRRAWGYVGRALEAKVLQFNAEQIQLADQRNHAVLEIARAAGIDPEDLGVSTTSRTYQNSEQRRQDLLDFTLQTYVAAFEQRLSMRDVLPRGYQAKVSLPGFLRSDTKTRMETYAIGKPIGAYTTEEIRELEDRPPLTAAELAELAPSPEPDPEPDPDPEPATQEVGQ